MGIKELLRENENKDLLRLLTCGSVDDGKSTMIGRLLHDSKQIYDDHLSTLEKDSKKVGSAGEAIDFSLLLDGLKAEREQGITIDVAYRYFSTPKRKFIIADCPGHAQYTRNMATGASTANLAVVLIDARHGVVEQTKRHSFIASLLDIGHIVVAINKMDLVDYSQEVYDKIRSEYEDFASRLEVRNIHFIPMSALMGDNIVEQSPNMPWFMGTPLLEYLQTVHIASDRNLIDMRFPVQYVLRQDMSFRGFCGTVASGILRPGSEVSVLPSGKRTKIKSIHTFEGMVDEAYPPMAVTVATEDEVDISRGDMLVAPNNSPRVSQSFDAAVVWMSEEPLDTERHYRIKHCSTHAQAEVTNVVYRFNVNTIGREEADSLTLNEIGRLRIDTSRPLAFDPYRRNRATGNFILIDPLSNATVAAGLILDRTSDEDQIQQPKVSTNIRQQVSPVSLEEREARLGQKSATIWLTGLPKSGKSTIANGLERHLFDQNRMVHVLDGENLRHGLSENLGFTALDRSEHIRRAASVAKMCNDLGLITVVALVSPYETDRCHARTIVGAEKFFEVHIDAPIEVCEERDTDGLYVAAKSGEIERFTGVTAPYEPPVNPDLKIDSKETPIDLAVQKIVDLLSGRGILG
ncbi:MAG: sulfate adenylyltransferase subunit CysN [Myxococcales bacterium]|nr:sulfate adenylyltransferase subunit CysN [Myxococcales bacterium]